MGGDTDRIGRPGHAIAGMPQRPTEAVDHVRHIVAKRRARSRHFPPEIFGEPAWDMLLDLFIAAHEGKPVSVSSACIASGAPATTALRWLVRLETLGLVTRSGDFKDRRRIHVAITDLGREAIEDWFQHSVSR